MNKYFFLILIVVVGLGILYLLPTIEPREQDGEMMEGSMSDTGHFMKGEEAWFRYDGNELGFSFEYRVSPDGYMFSEGAGQGTPDLLKVLTLTNGADAQELSESTDAREGPPVIRISVFDNGVDTQVADWVDQKSSISNIGLAKLNPSQFVIQGADAAVRYEVDGLYRGDTIVIANSDKIYLLVGEYMDIDSSIRRDFETLVDSLEFF